MKLCPFIYGSLVQPANFFNRSQELRRLLSRLNTGQSTAIVGQPKIGKTSLLNYLLDEGQRQELVGDRLDQCLFSYLDSHMLGSQFDQPAFWSHVLRPLTAKFKEGVIWGSYKLTKENQFGAFSLEQLFQQLDQAGWRLVLLLDEFDALLNHETLNKSEFYGSLRSLASRHSSLSLVIASRRSVDWLNLQTQAINPHGSPYFNVFTELQLGPLPHKDATTLLDQAGERFDRLDRQYIITVSGHHPYLLQAAASILWDVHDEGKLGPGRYRAAANELYRQTIPHFADTWRAWSIPQRKAITAIALAQAPTLVQKRFFLWQELIEDITDYEPELRLLKDAGTITQVSEDDWRITQYALLWWLADEIKRATRDDASFEDWLQVQELDKLLTGRERQWISQAAQQVSAAIGKGATTLIETFAQGFAKGVTGTK